MVWWVREARPTKAMNILSARRYPNQRNGPLSLQQAETRRLAYAIKDPASPVRDFDAAAREMAALIQTPCWLVPIPNSAGSTRANSILASIIATHCPGAQLAQALRRTRRIESQCSRHRRDLPSTPVVEHHIAATGRQLGCRQIYLIDNVCTSGNTLRAAHQALGKGCGLVFAATGHGHADGDTRTLL